MTPRLPFAVALALGGLAVAPGVAPAAWFPGPEIVSVDNARREQADGPTAAIDLSGDGRYAVVQTAATNFYPDGDADAPGTLRSGGLFRYDRATGALVVVADGDLLSDPGGTLVRRGAANASVSDDGRRVAFSTAQQLTPADTNDNIDVYVRDMDVPLGGDRQASGAYELVSALDLTSLPPNYEPRDPPLPGRTPGTNLWPGQSISADGRFVAFRTVEQRSDLGGTGPLGTPGGTVLVRDLVADRTTVVSRGRADGSPVGGSEAPVTLSADGSTVVWVGRNAPDQVPFLSGESADNQRPYYLWRRWADLGAATRRPTGSVDVDDPGCPANGSVDNADPVSTTPCYGPLTNFEQATNPIANRAPALSGDGYTVAFLSGAGLRPNLDQADGLDLFTTSMRPGVSRKAGTRLLTQDTATGNSQANGQIESVAISRDATKVVAITSRSVFIVRGFSFVGAPRTDLNVEPLMFDVSAGTIERIAFTPAGGPINGAASLNPSVSADGRLVAFASDASNILPGDANDVSDAFVATYRPPASGGSVAGTGVSTRPQSLSITSADDPEITVRTTRRKDGSIELRVKTPAAGRLTATASTRTRPKPPKGKAAKSSKKPRRVATATRIATKAETLTMVLRVPGADGRRIKAGSSLTATLAVRLAPKSGARLAFDDDVTFRGTPAKKPSKKKTRTKK